MKWLHVAFEDTEYERLLAKKGKDRTWRQFILELLKEGEKKESASSSQ